MWPPWLQRNLRDLVEATAEGPIIQHAVDVRVSEADLAGKAVVIVGGGMTSAQLALRACGGPAASVTLICRHKLRVRALDCEVRLSHLLTQGTDIGTKNGLDHQYGCRKLCSKFHLVMLQVGWYGNKELAAYRANCDHLQRLRMCQAARGCATINAHTMSQLQGAVKAGKLRLLEDREVANTFQDGHQICLSLQHGQKHVTKQTAASWAGPDCGKVAGGEDIQEGTISY